MEIEANNHENALLENRAADPLESTSPDATITTTTAAAAAAAAQSPPQKRKWSRPKLEPAACALLTEVFALQDSFTDAEISALAKKAKCTKAVAANYFNGLKLTVGNSIDRCKRLKSSMFLLPPEKRKPPVITTTKPTAPPHSSVTSATTTSAMGTPIATPLPGGGGGGVSAAGVIQRPPPPPPPPSSSSKPPLAPPLPRVAEGADAHRIALDYISSCTTARQSVADVFSAYLHSADEGGGIKDAAAFLKGGTTSILLSTAHSVSSQLLVLDSILATSNEAALSVLCSSIGLFHAVAAAIARGMKMKQHTLILKSLRVLLLLVGRPEATEPSWRMNEMLKNLVEDPHPGIKESAKNLQVLTQRVQAERKEKYEKEIKVAEEMRVAEQNAVVYPTPGMAVGPYMNLGTAPPTHNNSQQFDAVAQLQYYYPQQQPQPQPSSAFVTNSVLPRQTAPVTGAAAAAAAAARVAAPFPARPPIKTTAAAAAAAVKRSPMKKVMGKSRAPPLPPPPPPRARLTQGGMKEDILYTPPAFNLTALRALKMDVETARKEAAKLYKHPVLDFTPQPSSAPPGTIPFVPVNPEEMWEQNALMITAGVTSPLYVISNQRE